MTTTRLQHVARPVRIILSDENERCHQKIDFLAQVAFIGGILLMITMTLGVSLFWLHLRLQPLLTILGQG